MAHFAKVEKGIVVQVIVAEQSHVDTLDGDWVQTSYNTLGVKQTALLVNRCVKTLLVSAVFTTKIEMLSMTHNLLIVGH